MSLGSALGSALSGLRTSQRALGTISHNIANVNTENYSRQKINQASVYVEGVGNGVRIDEVTRAIDSFLRRSILTQNSLSQSSQVINNYHERLQVVLGEPGGEDTLDEGITTFFNTIRRMAETPERASFRSAAVNGATGLARQINDLSFRLEDLRFQADRDIKETVTTLNNTMRRLDQVNAALASSGVLGAPQAGLEDERDALLRNMSQKLEISTFFDRNGAVTVFTGNGISLVDGTRRELFYDPVQSVDTLAENGLINALRLVSVDSNGIPTEDRPIELISAGRRGEVTSRITNGELHGLQQIRDVIIPEFLTQLDTLAAGIRDTMNAVHNKGTAFPPPTKLTGTRAVLAGAESNWSGNVRLAVLKPDGQPVAAAFDDEQFTGWRPLNLDLERLDSGFGRSRPTVQGIIDEINNHFRTPSAKAKVGIFNNIQIASAVPRLPMSPLPVFTFDLDIDNISDSDGQLFVTSTRVFDDTTANITNIAQDVPSIAASATGTYSMTVGSRDVIVTLASPPNNITLGGTIFLNEPPAGLYNGIPHTELGGYFDVTAIVGNQVTIRVPTTLATGAVPINQAGIVVRPPYAEIDAGDKRRTGLSSMISADLSANVTSQYYDIEVDVGVRRPDGVITTSTVRYRIDNNSLNILNQRYDTTAVSGSGSRVLPNTTQDAARAILVDANGTELPILGGAYPPDTQGFLHIIGNNTNYRIALDELTSSQLGRLETPPPEQGTKRGFSHYFELNNMFASLKPTPQGDTLQSAAYYLKVEERLEKNPNLLANGTLELQRQPVNPTQPPQYTYVMYSGSNTNAQRLSEAGLKNVAFAAAGRLPSSQLTISAYASEFLGFAAAQSAKAQTDARTGEVLLSGFQERSEAISNVNLDEELANTIIYQNAYSASARMISVVDELFTDLLQTFA